MDGDPSSEWYSVIDPETKKTYYVNANTGETQWDPPAGSTPTQRQPNQQITSIDPVASTAGSSSARSRTTNRTILLARDMLHRHAMADDDDDPQQQQGFGTNNNNPSFDYIQNELMSLSAGQIADLVFEARSTINHHECYYDAMDPSDDAHQWNIPSDRPLAEISRIETRLHALRSEQQRLQMMTMMTQQQEHHSSSSFLL